MTCAELLEFLQTMSEDALKKAKIHFLNDDISTEIECIEIAQENFYIDDYWEDLYLESDLSESEIKDGLEFGGLDLRINKGDIILQ